MKKTSFKILICTALIVFSFVIKAQTDIKLPDPITTGGKPLMEALKERKTTRRFAETPLTNQMLSNLLWAANGINRPESGKRTAPSAVNWQEIDIYVFLSSGTYLWDAKTNTLKFLVAGDNRKITGKQSFTKEAAVNLVFVSDHSRMKLASKENKEFYSATDTGFISQNVYLFCASEGLATVVIGMLDREEIAKFLKLNDDQKVILSQCIGYPQ